MWRRGKQILALSSAAWLCAAAPAFSTTITPPPPDYQPDISSDEAGLWLQVNKMESDIKVAPNIIKDPALNAYLRSIICKLAADYCATVRVYIAEEPEFNAYAMPNGAIVVYTGLLLHTENEAQLAFILGHELTHFLHRHTLEHLRMTVATTGFLAVFGVAAAGAGVGYIGSLVNRAGVGAIFANSRDEERDADSNGFQLGVANNYAPDQAPEVWRFMVAEDNATKHHSRNMFLADHPASEERLATLQKAASGVPARSGWTVNADIYRAVAAPFLQRWIEDELARGEPQQSALLFERLCADDPSRSLYHYALGEAYRKRDESGDTTRALDAYHAALASADPPPQAWRGIGLVALKAGDKEDAKNALTTYLTNDPGAGDKAMIDFYLTQL